jgi:hypothetical protein
MMSCMPGAYEVVDSRAVISSSHHYPLREGRFVYARAV